jgi:hypothetical protein
MAAPNIVNVTSIIGITTAVGLSTTAVTTFLSNADASGKVLKINTIIASNIDGSANADITVKYHLAAAGAGTSIALANTITVPADASLVIIGKDNPIYLEENRSLTAKASAANDIAIVCSYEDIS